MTKATKFSPPSSAAVLPLDLLKKSVKHFEFFFNALAQPGVRERAKALYSDDAYFFDTLKECRGQDQIAEYLEETGRALESCRVEISDIAVSESSYYLRWTMEVTFRRLKKGKVCRSFGMSHLCFDKSGQISYHRDYWDSTAGFFELLPGLGWLIRNIKQRL